MERQEASHVTVVLNEAACCGPSVCVSEREPPAHLLYLVLRADRAARSAAAGAGSRVWKRPGHGIRRSRRDQVLEEVPTGFKVPL